MFIQRLLMLIILPLGASLPPTNQSLPSLDELESILDRAIIMQGSFVQDSSDFAENLKFLQDIGAKYAGRSVEMWGNESRLPSLLSVFEANMRLAHSLLPNLIVEGRIHEVVTRDVESLMIPASVFSAFELPPQPRTFSYANMLYRDGSFVDHWGPGASVPDFTQMETKLWFYYVATSYIQRGAEAINFGQVSLMARSDVERRHTWTLFSTIRTFASKDARRRFVLCTAQIFETGWSYTDILLMDFHSFPSRPRDDVKQPQHAYLDTACDVKCAPYRRSAGGKTVSGYQVESLPYLVELAGWGQSSTPGQHVPNSTWVWGWDEITWFANQPDAMRKEFLSYELNWLRDQDTRGHFAMPGLCALSDGTKYYAKASKWRADAEAITALWSPTPKVANTMRSGDLLFRNGTLTSQNGDFVLIFQNGGNLVEFDKRTNQPVWAAYTAPNGQALQMQWDGNLVMKDQRANTLWDTGSAGHSGAFLMIHNDGNIAIYYENNQELWNRRTVIPIDNRDHLSVE